MDGSWRFVQCNWGARHLVNAKELGVKNGGRPIEDTNEILEGDANLRYEYDDHYYMTDPVIFKLIFGFKIFLTKSFF